MAAIAIPPEELNPAPPDTSGDAALAQQLARESDSSGSSSASGPMARGRGVFSLVLVTFSRHVLLLVSVLVVFYSIMAVAKIGRYDEVKTEEPLKLWFCLFSVTELSRIGLSFLRSYYVHVVYSGRRRETIWWRKILQPLGFFIDICRGAVWAIGYFWLFDEDSDKGDAGTKDLLFWCRVCWGLLTVLLYLPLCLIALLLSLLPCLILIVPFFSERSPNQTETDEAILNSLVRRKYEEVLRTLRTNQQQGGDEKDAFRHTAPEEGLALGPLRRARNDESVNGGTPYAATADERRRREVSEAGQPLLTAAEQSEASGMRDQHHQGGSDLPNGGRDPSSYTSAPSQSGPLYASSGGSSANPLSSLFLHTDCKICLQAFSPEDEVVCLPCDARHFFHSSCVLQWLKVSQLCPVCRRNVAAMVRQAGRNDESSPSVASPSALAQGNATATRAAAEAEGSAGSNTHDRSNIAPDVANQV